MASFHVIFQIAHVKSGIVALVTLVVLYSFMNCFDVEVNVTLAAGLVTTYTADCVLDLEMYSLHVDCNVTIVEPTIVT